ncbi:MAG: hypothetical protein J6U10_05700 [Lachnospiraceae bacterium]|nr:hypothetical protein [Lachnospiraceae bacterium]
MKNEKIISAFSKIEPDEKANEKMLAAVLEKNRSTRKAAESSPIRKATESSFGFGLPGFLKVAVPVAALGVVIATIIAVTGGKPTVSKDPATPSGAGTPAATASAKTPDDNEPDPVLQPFSPVMTAADYFKNSRNTTAAMRSGSSSKLIMPNALIIDISGNKNSYEQSGRIPQMPDCYTSIHLCLNGDGSLYKVDFQWGKQDAGINTYSHLQFEAAPCEVNELKDEFYICVDENGNEIPEPETITIRDNIKVYARGFENGEKTVTWETAGGWYRVTGSFNDSFETVIALYDWFFTHPLDLAAFESEVPKHMIFSDRASYPDAFEGRIPDFAALGYTAQEELVNVADSVYSRGPVWFSGLYTKGDTCIRWTINTGADSNAWKKSIGRLADITESAVKEVLGKGNSFNIFSFSPSPAMITVTLENGSPADVWELIQSIRQ